jgi:hypothetical protein
MKELVEKGGIWTPDQQRELSAKIQGGKWANGLRVTGASIERIEPYVWMKSYRQVRGGLATGEPVLVVVPIAETELTVRELVLELVYE